MKDKLEKLKEHMSYGRLVMALKLVVEILEDHDKRLREKERVEAD